MPFLTQGKTNWKYILIVAILAVIVGGGTFWFSTKQEIPYQPTEIKKPEATDWKTYRNEKYGFEFKYPNNWIKAAEPCDYNPFCLFLFAYSELPESKDVDVCFEINIDECTKEGFDSYKDALSSGILPKGLDQVVWKLIKLDGKNAMQGIFYHIYSGTYAIQTKVYTDDVLISLSAVLPIQPFYKEDKGIKWPDIEKSQEREIDLNKGIFPNKETERVMLQYNQMLSTFKFLE